MSPPVFSRALLPPHSCSSLFIVYNVFRSSYLCGDDYPQETHLTVCSLHYLVILDTVCVIVITGCGAVRCRTSTRRPHVVNAFTPDTSLAVGLCVVKTCRSAVRDVDVRRRASGVARHRNVARRIQGERIFTDGRRYVACDLEF